MVMRETRPSVPVNKAWICEPNFLSFRALVNSVELNSSVPSDCVVLIPNWESTVNWSPEPATTNSLRTVATSERAIASPDKALRTGLPSASMLVLVSEFTVLMSVL
ncbi:hypothetical protein D3C86_1693350 [compost metagenome]